MNRRREVVRPPALPGVLDPRPVDVVRMVWWARAGYIHGARHADRRRTRIYSRILAAAWWPLWPVSTVVQAVLVARPRARYYLSPERDAVIAAVATRGGWDLCDHLSARPGTRRGRALRDLIRAPLLQAADNLGIDVTMTATTNRLAEIYAGEIPGMVDVGRARPRGRRLRRPAAR